jgi:DnaK suppressor protein
MPFSHEQLNELRRASEKRRAALAAELRSDAARIEDDRFAGLAGEVRDAGEDAIADLLADVGIAELTRDARELRDLDAALERFQRGRYGVCLDCEVQIDFERLKAQLGAQRCLSCQQRHEKTHAGQPGNTL